MITIHCTIEVKHHIVAASEPGILCINAGINVKSVKMIEQNATNLLINNGTIKKPNI